MKKMAIVLFLLGYSGLASAYFQSAMRALERGHYATAERALRKPAALGEARVQNNLECLY